MDPPRGVPNSIPSQIANAILEQIEFPAHPQVSGTTSRLDGGRMDGLDGWMDGRMEGWKDGWKHGRIEGMDGRDGWMDGWKEGNL